MITIVIGGQYGGEGKGKVCAYLALVDNFAITCRCGGPNSSHTIVNKGRTIRLRMMPTAAVVRPDIQVVFGAGTLIHRATLFSEMEDIGFRGKILIDPRAGIITEELVEAQRADKRYEHIGSTLTGTGYASAERCLRRLPLAREFRELSPFLGDTAENLDGALQKGAKVLVEGHQGFGLSNYHGDYPYTSSRDATAAAMLSELGIGPRRHPLKIVLTVKVFPTRNHPGHLAGEISSSEADAIGVKEFGGGSWGNVPNRRRRVGLFDASLVKAAVVANSPTGIAITGIDHLDKVSRGATHFAKLGREGKKFVRYVREMSKTPVNLVSTGRETEAMVCLDSTLVGHDAANLSPTSNTPPPLFS